MNIEGNVNHPSDYGMCQRYEWQLFVIIECHFTVFDVILIRVLTNSLC